MFNKSRKTNFIQINKFYRIILILILATTTSFVSVYAQDDAKSSLIKVGEMDLTWPPFKGSSVGKGITVKNNEIKLASPSKTWKGHWDAGRFRLPGNGIIVLRAEVKGGNASFTLQRSNGTFLPKPDSVKFKNNLYEATWLLKNSKFQILSSLWMTLSTEGDAIASAKILELSVCQTLKKNNLDADKILKTPPVHRAELKLHNGAMTMFVDDQPITGQSWSSLVLWRVNNNYLKKVLPELDYPITSIPITIGEDPFNNFFPSSWLAHDVYDWSYLDTQVHRVLKVRPKSKLVLMLVLNGAVWWNEAHPESANFEVDAKYAKYTGVMKPKGIPDYLSPLWRADIREALRQLVAHVQSSDWGEAVVAYELKNGSTMDCNFVVPHSNPRAINDFRKMLKKKYLSDEALQAAWKDPKVTLGSALPWTAKFPAGLILEPAKYQHFLDTKKFIANQFRAVFSDVAKILKEATHGRAIVGARTGDFHGNSNWKNEWFKMEDTGWLPPLLSDPNFDYFDVQEPYPGRQLGGGTGVPIIPPFALQQYGKTVIVQNDVRTHLSKPNVGYGRTPDLASTIQLQRKIFANSLINNTITYLYQLAFRYNNTDLLTEYRTQEMIKRKALTLDRSSVAQTAIVLDPRMRLYMGSDPKQNTPTGYTALLDHTKHVWQRAGAPFDMIFLDQIENLPPYRVYVFCNTWRYTPEQIRMIRKKVLTNGQCAVFLWADGLISDDGSFSAKTVSKLTGMKIQMSRKYKNWHMKATNGVPGLIAGTELGTLAKANYGKAARGAAEWEYEPSFKIEKGEGVVPLAHRVDGSISAAMRRDANYTVIYSTSGNLTPPIFKLALKNASAFRYTDSSALLMMNRSYLALHTDKDETIKLKLPVAQRLVNLFTGEVLPKNTVFEIPVRKNHTYVFERKEER